MRTKSSIKPPVTFDIVSGDKGGVGKSFTALTLIDVLVRRGKEVVVIEADTSNPDVARMYRDTLSCYYVDLATENGWMEIMDIVIKHPGCAFVMSAPAGAGTNIQTHLPSLSGFLAQHKSPLELELWWAMNPQHDSVNLLSKAIKLYGHHFQKIRVVCNLHFSDNKQDAFFLWHESPLRTKLENDGGLTLMLEGLNLRVVTKLFDPERIMPFSEAVDVSLGEKVGLTESERYKLSSWRQRQYDNFSAAMVPTPAPETSATAA